MGTARFSSFALFTAAKNNLIQICGPDWRIEYFYLLLFLWTSLRLTNPRLSRNLGTCWDWKRGDLCRVNLKKSARFTRSVGQICHPRLTECLPISTWGWIKLNIDWPHSLPRGALHPFSDDPLHRANSIRSSVKLLCVPCGPNRCWLIKWHAKPLPPPFHHTFPKKKCEMKFQKSN